MSRREKLERMLQSDPQDVFLQYALAMEYASEGDLPAALNQLECVLKGVPNYVAAHFQKGQLLAQQGQINSARQALTQGIEVARQVGDRHAEAEMREFLAAL